jgi:hypothetical protein
MSVTRRQFVKSTFYGIGIAAVSKGISPVLLASEAKQKGFEICAVQLLSNGFEEIPAMTSDAKGNAWIVTLDWQPAGQQNIAFYQFKDSWQKTGFVAQESGSYETPVIACANDGRPMVVWSCEKDTRWTLESAIYDGQSFSYSCSVDGPGRAANPALAAGVKNDYWLVWENYREGVFEIYLKHLIDGAWQKPIAVSLGGPNSYDPAVAVSSDGKVYIAYTQADGPHRTVKLVCYNPQDSKIHAPIDVAAGGMADGKPNINTHPAMAFDSQGRLWITWEAREVNTNEPRTSTTCYFGTRCCPVVCYQDGQIQKFADSNVNVFKGANDHRPVFVKSQAGNLWIFTRNSEKIRKWHVRASSLTSRGWSEPFVLIDDRERGRGDQLAVAPGPDNTLHIGWQADNFRHGVIEEVKSQLFAARFVLPANVQGIDRLSFEPVSLIGYHGKDIGRPWQPRRKVTIQGQDYTLLYGNLHEHTNFSGCWVDGSDGDLDENYRYGLDVEGYDFIALTDHGYDLNGPRWRKNRRAVRFYNDPQRLVAMPAYEWTLSSPQRPLGSGHRNVIFKSDADAAKWVTEQGIVYHMRNPETNRIDRVWNLLKKKDCAAVTIPHHPADKSHPVCWEYINHDYQMVVEIFQFRRSAEYRGCPDHTYKPTSLDGCYVQDALARGHKLGFVSSGDHNSMGIGVTALWVKEVSQAGIIEALQARRCYGTSGDKIFIDFRINDAFMGQELAIKGKPAIKAQIEAVLPLINVVLFKNNKIIWEKNKAQLNDAINFEFTFVDQEFDSDSYYYVRAIQTNGQIVWASPIWCTKQMA